MHYLNTGKYKLMCSHQVGLRSKVTKCWHQPESQMRFCLMWCDLSCWHAGPLPLGKKVHDWEQSSWFQLLPRTPPDSKKILLSRYVVWFLSFSRKHRWYIQPFKPLLSDSSVPDILAEVLRATGDLQRKRRHQIFLGPLSYPAPPTATASVPWHSFPHLLSFLG